MDHTEDAKPSDEPGQDDQRTGVDVVQFYWRPGCMFCMILRRGLRRRGIPLEEHNIWEEPAAAEIVRSVASGNETVPTVVVSGTALVNPSTRQVEDLVAESAAQESR